MEPPPEDASRPGGFKNDAGWSSPVAREAHNLEVAGSNPVPATHITPGSRNATSRGFLFCRRSFHPIQSSHPKNVKLLRPGRFNPAKQHGGGTLPRMQFSR